MVTTELRTKQNIKAKKKKPVIRFTQLIITTLCHALIYSSWNTVKANKSILEDCWTTVILLYLSSKWIVILYESY